jgi:hypothetical protein
MLLETFWKISAGWHNKILIVFFIPFICSCSNLKKENLKIFGETSYLKQDSESLNTQVNLTYKESILESKNWEAFIEGKITTDYDHFNSEIKNNVFTTIGIEF